MYEVKCLDSRNNTINYFTQWDINQTIYIKMDDLNFKYVASGSAAYNYPEIHFCNTKMNERYIVRSSSDDNGKTIKANVPNILLQESYPILIYVYMVDSSDLSSQKVVLRNEIPVRKAVKPSYYMYVDNIDRITANTIKNEIEASVNDEKLIAEQLIKSQLDAKIDGSFMNQCNKIVGDINAVLGSTQTIYDNSEIESNKITENIKEASKTLIDDGLYIKTTYNEGSGNVDVSIVFDEGAINEFKTKINKL